jgi:general secretion pathway protein A
MAFNTLFARWDKIYQAELDTTPCEQAVSQGLACLNRQGSLGSLRHLNRPAVLQLVDQQGRRFYAPLIKLTDNKASLIINAKEVVVGTNDLEKQWFGSYTILWQPPPGYSKPIKPGAEDQDVEWLSNQIQKATGLESTSTDLSQMVTAFQKSEGLIADGIAGPETLIHLNSSVGRTTGPVLVEK